MQNAAPHTVAPEYVRLPHYLAFISPWGVTREFSSTRREPDLPGRDQFRACGRQPLPWDYFRVARDPPRIDAKCGDHFLQADYSLLKPVVAQTSSEAAWCHLSMNDMRRCPNEKF